MLAGLRHTIALVCTIAFCLFQGIVLQKRVIVKVNVCWSPPQDCSCSRHRFLSSLRNCSTKTSNSQSQRILLQKRVIVKDNVCWSPPQDFSCSRHRFLSALRKCSTKTSNCQSSCLLVSAGGLLLSRAITFVFSKELFYKND